LLRRGRATPLHWGPIYFYPTEHVAWIVAVLSVVLATALLVGGITTLYYVRPMEKRLGVVGAFTVFFAASIGLLTNARRAEVFGATAA